INLLFDIAIAVAFVFTMDVRYTGLRLHERLGLAFGAALVVHLALHWKWIYHITRTFFRRLFHSSRSNYVLNTALLINMLVIIVTGIGVSNTLGIRFGTLRALMVGWVRIHVIASEISIILVGLHIAVHWKWIIASSRKYLFNSKYLSRQLVQRGAP